MLRDDRVETSGGYEHDVVAGGVATAAFGKPGDGEHGARCDHLHRRLKRIAKARGALDLQEAEALREAQRIQLWRRFGYGSLAEYMELQLGYAPRIALIPQDLAAVRANCP